MRALPLVVSRAVSLGVSTRMGGAVRDVGTCAGEGWGDLLDLQREYSRSDT